LFRFLGWRWGDEEAVELLVVLCEQMILLSRVEERLYLGILASCELQEQALLLCKG
jgi:hypothetical protein